MPKAIFWDMDGTLIDSEPLWGIATYELSERLGRRITPEIREETIGGSFAHTLGLCAQWAGVSLNDDEAAAHKSWMYERMGQLLSEELEPNPGVPGLLSSLHSSGMRMLVTTNTERYLANYCIDAVGREYFEDTITGDEVAHGKPDPEMYLEAAARVGESPADCLVFEDSWAGMSAAAAAGCKVLGLAEKVPAGVVPFDSSRFIGATAEDVATWFKAMG
ncbi:HAD family hydrolase [Corynebacterium lubricantis]|uniref:HAD family hydrolase n=1 Tax=Corynebacterium lubricantis TaxID=541095 RepID=UPI00036265F2|nr:HAD family phosphatase [Corynebacterium lubricantis]